MTQGQAIDHPRPLRDCPTRLFAQTLIFKGKLAISLLHYALYLHDDPREDYTNHDYALTN